MTFIEIFKYLEEGRVVRRVSWANCFVIFKQIPAQINNDLVWNMKSVPTDMKVLCKQLNLGINYANQYIIYDIEDQTATYINFDGDDLNADDWEVIDPFNYDISGK